MDESLLIVEDNDALREGLREMLSYEGYVIFAARNGEEALHLLGDKTPSLILSDIAMPVMDGIEFYTIVRDHPEWLAIPFVFLTAKTERMDVLAGKTLGVDDYLTKPISREELVTTIRSRLNRTRQSQVAQLEHAYLASLTALANAVDRREMANAGHVDRVKEYSLATAQQLGWNERQLTSLRYGAILHDIGKIHIPESILFKLDPLAPEEWEIIHRHPIIGAEMVKAVPFLAGISPIIRHHHERWDGQGYPDHLAGDLIPLEARLVAISDAFDVMTIGHIYKPPISLQDAFSEILDLAGKNYDPLAVAAFERAWKSQHIQAIAANC
jgi:putative two-component system response regulator